MSRLLIGTGRGKDQEQETKTKDKLLHEEGKKEPEGKQNVKNMQEQIVGLWAWQKSKYTVSQDRSDAGLAAGRGSCSA